MELFSSLKEEADHMNYDHWNVNIQHKIFLHEP